MSYPPHDRDGHARLSDVEIDELDKLLAQVPHPFEAMDAAMLDGFLAGLAVLPEPVDTATWLPHLFHTTPDPAARPLTPGGTERVAALAERRLSFVRASLSAREPYDPILFALPDEAPQADQLKPAQLLAPWAAGFANAMGAFPVLVERDDDELAALLVGIYRHLPAEEQETALRELQAEADQEAPLEDVDDAIDDVMGCLLGIAEHVQPRKPQLRAAPKVGRNDPCPCGSGRKFKQCHGKT